MMQMNREWMNSDRRSPEYIAGIQAFSKWPKPTRTQRIHVLSMLFGHKRQRLLWEVLLRIFLDRLATAC
jgi:hypothetical protein